MPPTDINKLLKTKFPFINLLILRSRIEWSITLRWVAIVSFFLATLFAKHLLNVALPVNTMWTVLVFLALLNLIYLFIIKIVRNFTFFTELIFLFIHIIIDLVLLTVLINLTGGIENPLFLFYIFHVVLSSIMFPRWAAYILTTFVIFLFGTLVFLEYNQFIEHHFIFNTGIYQNKALIYSTLFVFAITTYVSAYICTSFMIIFRRIKREIDDLNEKLVKTDQQKTQFFQYTSHELKSPIIAVKSSIDGVVANFADKMDQKAVNILKRASYRSEQMIDIIRELLDLLQNRSFISKKKEKIDIISELENVIENENHAAQIKEIKLIEDLCNERPLITGRKGDFEKVFSNILSNAIRYNKDKGSVFIRTFLNKEALNIEISDTGIGIPEQDRQNIFAEFYRSENAKKKFNFGTGLGLSLVKQIIENYKGSISIDSQLNKGTTFLLKIPIKGRK